MQRQLIARQLEPHALHLQRLTVLIRPGRTERGIASALSSGALYAAAARLQRITVKLGVPDREALIRQNRQCATMICQRQHRPAFCAAMRAHREIRIAEQFLPMRPESFRSQIDVDLHLFSLDVAPAQAASPEMLFK
ncbi:hypothetical protein WHW93_14000 [Serratia marcescens]|uniref:hypothetical protein n=1 Tax=Serratia marcescens TaxID=615 RepID=UPI00339BBAD8